MIINAALIIQAIHFLIAWFLLDRFLFKQLVHLVQEENKKQKILLEYIAQKKEWNSLEKNNQLQFLIKRKQIFLTHTPLLEKKPTILFSSLLCPLTDLSPEEKRILIDDVRSHIIQKVLS